ncbi:MAG: spore coat associated protein CotJA [Lachnospiraceae bacterium]|nr:spore coat associated protein CotJA [Lachnospiraceae bacterium]NBJ80948.1 spore coat associated protein CotJA [bacterium 1XD42-76]NBK04157.1 spore coat associated protein CotJA [bacterium 1XD42-94]
MDFCTCRKEIPPALAVAFVPVQPWETTYEPSEGLLKGTIFPSLDLPFFATGGDGIG